MFNLNNITLLTEYGTLFSDEPVCHIKDAEEDGQIRKNRGNLL